MNGGRQNGSMKLTIGIDEAGRGCVLGPLVIACVVADDADRRWFWTKNVRDSKLVPAEQRDRLAQGIKERCWFRLSVIHPPEIDLAVADRALTLNGLERDAMADLLRDAREDFPEAEATALVDAPSINAQGFLEQLYVASGWDDMDRLKAKHEADRRDRTVAAASILAKAERERWMANLKRDIGCDVGSGYCHDPRTIAHLKAAPEGAAYVRWSWSTAKERNADALMNGASEEERK